MNVLAVRNDKRTEFSDRSNDLHNLLTNGLAQVLNAWLLGVIARLQEQEPKSKPDLLIANEAAKPKYASIRNQLQFQPVAVIKRTLEENNYLSRPLEASSLLHVITSLDSLIRLDDEFRQIPFSSLVRLQSMLQTLPHSTAEAVDTLSETDKANLLESVLDVCRHLHLDSSFTRAIGSHTGKSSTTKQSQKNSERTRHKKQFRGDSKPKSKTTRNTSRTRTQLYFFAVTAVMLYTMYTVFVAPSGGSNASFKENVFAKKQVHTIWLHHDESSKSNYYSIRLAATEMSTSTKPIYYWMGAETFVIDSSSSYVDARDQISTTSSYVSKDEAVVGTAVHEFAVFLDRKDLPNSNNQLLVVGPVTLLEDFQQKANQLFAQEFARTIYVEPNGNVVAVFPE